MSEENLKRITVIIAGRSFPVKVSNEEESLVRSIEKEVNEKLNDLQLSYQGKDMQDYMSLAILSYAFELQKSNNSEEVSKLDKRLEDLEHLLNQ
jgi:cell division protein ZapA